MSSDGWIYRVRWYEEITVGDLSWADRHDMTMEDADEASARRYAQNVAPSRPDRAVRDVRLDRRRPLPQWEPLPIEEP